MSVANGVAKFFRLLFLVSFLFGFGLNSASASSSASNYLSFPQADNPNTPIDESLHGNPSNLAISPVDGKLYMGLFGSFDFFPQDPAYKGIGRVDDNGTFEVILQFPSTTDGIVEKMVFAPNGDLYVNAGNYITSGSVANGIVKVNVNTGSYAQFWTAPPFATPGTQPVPGQNSALIAGLARDVDGSFYVSDPVIGQIFKVDSNGNGSLWLFDSLLQGDGSVFGTPFGVNGIIYDSKRKRIYGINMDSGSVIRINIKPDGSAGKPKVLIQDARLLGGDNVSLSADKNKLYVAGFTQGNIVEITLENNNGASLNVIADGLGDIVHAIPSIGFGGVSPGNFLAARLGKVSANDPRESDKGQILLVQG